ncbi:helix-turn-helix transcriptional regulator [Bradyrhizobium sp. RD5-C2]|uniref:helix-turn-helix domain-containing protein n=1 Tax=Bradyrhizobium sp. RD5-C2 TaxID=244562 RepID=UPI001CC59815
MSNKRGRPRVGVATRVGGRRLRTARRAATATQLRLASELCVSPQQIQNYEGGKSNIPVRRLLQAAHFLHVTPDFLLARDPPGYEDIPEDCLELGLLLTRLFRRSRESYWHVVDEATSELHRKGELSPEQASTNRTIFAKCFEILDANQGFLDRDTALRVFV